MVYTSSSDQLSTWHQVWGEPAGLVNPLPITSVASQIEVAAPDAELSGQVRELHARLRRVGGSP